MGWYSTVKEAMYEALCASFGLDPDSEQALNRFVPAYIEDTIKPQAPRNLDVTYYAINNYQEDSGFNYIMAQQTSLQGNAKTEIKKTIPASVLVTFYGPNADDDAEQFWSSFQWDNGSNSPRAMLRKHNIVPIGKPDRPVALYEVEGTYQRRRSDVQVDVAYYEVSVYDSSEVDSAPEITFQTQPNSN